MNEWILFIGQVGFPSALAGYMVYKGVPVLYQLALAVEHNTAAMQEFRNFLIERFK